MMTAVVALAMGASLYEQAVVTLLHERFASADVAQGWRQI